MIKTATNEYGTTKRCRIIKLGPKKYRIDTDMHIRGNHWEQVSGPTRRYYRTEARACRAAIRWLNRYHNPPTTGGLLVEEQ